MTYDPFVRGPLPVGVRSGEIVDVARDDRRLPFEVCYPATSRYFALDLIDATQDTFMPVEGRRVFNQAAVRDAEARAARYPLVVFSHPSGGHRRQSSFLCTHLASHGYVVAAVDHTGNTVMDIADRARRLSTGQASPPPDMDAVVQQIIAARVPDIRFLVDQMLAGAADVASLIDPERIGLAGWSIGGWAVLATPEVDDRIGAVVAMAPAGNSKPLPGIIPATLTFAWKREVPTLILAGDQDRFTPLPGQYELYERTPSQRQLFILAGAGHTHFGDQIDEYDLCPRQHAQFFVRGLALSHLDAALKGNGEALHFIQHEAADVLKQRGVDAIEYAGV